MQLAAYGTALHGSISCFGAMWGPIALCSPCRMAPSGALGPSGSAPHRDRCAFGSIWCSEPKDAVRCPVCCAHGPVSYVGVARRNVKLFAAAPAFGARMMGQRSS